MSASRRNRAPWGVFALGLLPPLLMLGVSLAWSARYPAGGNPVYLGMLQGDQPLYTALARGVFWRGNGLVYANPFDCDSAAPRVLSNLGYTAVGCLMRLFGGRAAPAWEAWRLAFGALAYGLWGAVVWRVIRGRTLRWLVWLGGALGGGAGWMLALARSTADGSDMLGTFNQVEAHYAWWLLNFFRQSLYPLELCYHALFLAALLLLLARRRAALLGLMALLWWTHPLTASLATSVVGLGLALDWLAPAERRARRANTLALAGLAVIFGVAVFYYQRFLPSFPSVASWLRQTMAFDQRLPALDHLPAYGLALGAVPLALALRRSRRWLLRRRAGRFTLLWGAMVTAWSLNYLVLRQPIQPLHFLRGHLFLFLILTLGKTADCYRREIRARAARLNVSPAVLGLIPLALLLPDNILFMARLFKEAPQANLLVIGRASAQGLEYFRRAPRPPAGRVIASFDHKFGTLLVMQGERVWQSEDVFTPFCERKRDAFFEAVKDGGAPALKRLGITTLVLPVQAGLAAPWMSDLKQMKTVFANEELRIAELE